MKPADKVVFYNDRLQNDFNLLPDEDPIKKGIIKAIQDMRKNCQTGIVRIVKEKRFANSMENEQ